MRPIILLMAAAILVLSSTLLASNSQLLNVSYDTSREFYEAYNKMFREYWLQKTAQKIDLTQSHGGSGAQARSVIEGLPADVVTLALGYDIDLIAQKSHLINRDWQKQFPNNSSPYNSPIVFLVRPGNPKSIKDWPDLIREGVQVVTPNPKTSGLARWNYLAAWVYALKQNNNNEQAARDFITKLYQHAPVLDIAGRTATNTFVQRGIGDALITWEDEAYLIMSRIKDQKFVVIHPSITILAEPPVAVVTANASRKGNAMLAKAYLEFLYSPQAQELMARFFYRPTNIQVFAKYRRLFPQIQFETIQQLGGWLAVHKKHFSDGGIFDQIFHPGSS